MPTISVTIPQTEIKRVTDACVAQTGLEPKAALVQYLKNLVISYEYTIAEKDVVESVIAAKKKVPKPAEPEIT